MCVLSRQLVCAQRFGARPVVVPGRPVEHRLRQPRPEIDLVERADDGRECEAGNGGAELNAERREVHLLARAVSGRLTMFGSSALRATAR